MFDHLLRHFGTPRYTKEQQYRVSYEVRVTNISKIHQDATLIIPVVSMRETQTLLDGPIFAPETEIAIEEKFGNRYAKWPIALPPQGEQLYKQLFQIRTAPAIKKGARAFTVSDYATLDADLRRKYLEPNTYLESDDPEIIDLAKRIQGKGTKVLQTLKRINEFVISRVTYGNPIPGLYKATATLGDESRIKSGTTGIPVDCGGFATLFVSLCQALGIPARIVSGFWAGYHKNDMHAWVEILLPDGSWLPADPATEQLNRLGRSKKSGKLGFVGSDRITFSVGCDLDVTAGPDPIDADILQNPIVYPANDYVRAQCILSTQPL